MIRLSAKVPPMLPLGITSSSRSAHQTVKHVNHFITTSQPEFQPSMSANKRKTFSHQTIPMKRPKPSILDFTNTEQAYKYRSLTNLIRSFFVYKLFSFGFIVDRSEKLINSGRSILGQKLFEKLMKATVYGQFVAGEDLDTLKPVVARMRREGIRSILDYAVEDDVKDEKEVIMEIRQKDLPAEWQPTPSDLKAYPQFQPSTVKGQATVRSSARTYFYEDEKKCDQNMENFLDCINVAASASEGEDAFAAIKLTGLGRTEFLLRLSEVVEGTHKLFNSLSGNSDHSILTCQKHITPETFQRGFEKMEIELSQDELDRLFAAIDTDKSGKLNIFQWCNHFQPGTEVYKLINSKGKYLLATLTEREVEQMTSVLRRAETLAECAQEKSVRLMVDAEQTYYQPAIRHIAVNVLMPKYNQSRPVIYNTQQCYLMKALDSVHLDLLSADVSGFHYGVKLVRGAYMEQERQLSMDKGYPDPIWPTKDGTDACYHEILQMLIEKVTKGRTHILVASHNEDTVKYAVEKMSHHQISNDSGSVVFGQLLGMADHITAVLGSQGYHAYKYMPYGPVMEAIPYLIRRANENRGMLAGAVVERRLLRNEISRRLFRM